MAMGRPLPLLTLDGEEREALVLRARIILSGADGLDNTAVSVQLGVSKEHRELTALDFGYNLREDQCRVRKDHGPQNLTVLRQVSHNLLKTKTFRK